MRGSKNNHTSGGKVLATGALLLAGLLGGCGSSGEDTPQSLAVASDDPSTTAAQIESTPAAPVSAPTGKVAFAYVEPDGVTVEATLTYSQPYAADDPGLAALWQAMTTLAPPTTCAQDPSRDVVVVGSLSFRNDDPGFAPTDLAVRFIRPQAEDDQVLQSQFYVHPGGEDGCDTNSDFVRPAMADSGTWGPVPVEYVIPGANGPSGFAPFVQAALEDVEIQDFAPEGGPCNCTLQPGAGTRGKYDSPSPELYARLDLAR